jgi:hypothetical protein
MRMAWKETGVMSERIKMISSYRERGRGNTLSLFIVAGTATATALRA